MANLTTGSGYGRTTTHSWTLTDQDEMGDSVNSPGNPDRTVQVFGTFNGGFVTLEGSNDGTNWATLHDPTGADLIFTGARIASIMENASFTRAIFSGAAGEAAVSVLLASRSS